MTEYPGAYPLDPTTPVGQVRLNVGDTTSVPLSPAVVGQQSYSNFSDAELQSYLTTGNSSVARATALAFTALAGFVADASIKTDDLAVDPSKWAAVYMQKATFWGGIADKEDIAAANNVFQILPFAGLSTQDPCFF